jgi:hypothetical protein
VTRVSVEADDLKGATEFIVDLVSRTEPPPGVEAHQVAVAMVYTGMYNLRAHGAARTDMEQMTRVLLNLCDRDSRVQEADVAREAEEEEDQDG